MASNRTSTNRLMIFFVLVAVALVWTWSQVGQRQGVQQQVIDEDIELLRTEPGCDLALGPCAAYLKTMAVVAVVRAEGQGVRWQVKLVAQEQWPDAEVSLQLLPPEQAARPLDVRRDGETWSASSPGRVLPGSILRVRVSGGELPLIADFPLQGER